MQEQSSYCNRQQKKEHDIMKNASIIDRATNALRRYRTQLIRRRDAQRVAGLPDYLLKDIGWPAAELDVCADCTQ
jgi:hypothetical protein